MTHSRLRYLILLTGTCLILVSACTGTGSTGQPGSGIGPTPEFSGPWAQEFQHAYQSVTTDLARKILWDGTITADEMAELQTTYTDCLENLGFTDISIGQYGQMELRVPPGAANPVDLLDQCGQTTGWNQIDSLRTFIHGNPEHIDVYAIMAECLVRVGLKPDGYTADDYRRDFESQAFNVYVPGTPDGQKFANCNVDPAHAT